VGAPRATIGTRGGRVMRGRGDRSEVQELRDEAARWRKSCQEARAALRRVQAQLLDVHLRAWLEDPSDFGVYFDDAAVFGADGSLDVERLERLLEELLVHKPHLAARAGNPRSANMTG
jgi:hypothetical protein